MFDEAVISEPHGLFETGHALYEFYENVSLVHQWDEILLVNYFGSNLCGGKPHVLGLCERGSVVHIFDDNLCNPCIRHGDGAVD